MPARSEKELQGDTVRLKKYFYALRPILAAMWIAEKRELPPMEFSQLRTFLRPNLNATVDNLLKIKAEADEKHRVETIRPLNEFIWENLLKCEEVAQDLHGHRADSKPLDALFRDTLFQFQEAQM